MTVAELQDLYEYNRWAHQRTLEAAIELTNEQCERVVGGSFPSVRATLEHMLGAEVIWLSRWEGHSLGNSPDFTGLADVTALQRIWDSFWHRQFIFLESLSDDELTRQIAIRTRSGIETVQPLGETMIHVMNHSTYHRGQVAGQIRQVGGTPNTTDYFIYCLTKGVTETDE
jgi:uncharacterized damage-inducible protein DinB